MLDVLIGVVLGTAAGGATFGNNPAAEIELGRTAAWPIGEGREGFPSDFPKTELAVGAAMELLDGNAAAVIGAVDAATAAACTAGVVLGSDAAAVTFAVDAATAAAWPAARVVDGSEAAAVVAVVPAAEGEATAGTAAAGIEGSVACPAGIPVVVLDIWSAGVLDAFAEAVDVAFDAVAINGPWL